jgi:transposase
MAKRHFQLSESQARGLRRAEQDTRNTLALRRLQAVRLYGTGVAMGDIQNIVGASERTVRRWVQQYLEKDLDGLKPGWTGQNANRLTSEQRATIKDRLHSYRPDPVLSPGIRISQGMFWTVSDLQLAVQQWYGVSYQSADSYHHLLAECGFSDHRAERVYRSRPAAVDIAAFEAELEKK